MRTFRILLALAVAAGTFYSLNALAVQYGYRDRLDFKNRHYHGDCNHGQHSKRSFSHHRMPMADTIVPTDSINNLDR